MGKEKWNKYINMKTKDRHQSNARKAVKWLSSKRLAKKSVAMACEIQLIYKPYFFYRKNVHFLYKVLRSEDLSQFLRDFAPQNDKVRRSTLVENARRAEWAKERNTRHSVRMVGATNDSTSTDILPDLNDAKEITSSKVGVASF